MLILTDKGLYCPAGDFYIDPHGKVDHAVITHAHSDHARRGSRKYYCVSIGVELLRNRIGKSIDVQTFDYREPFVLRGVKLSFHPAGHILGSCQVRIEHEGRVWVASGDYKREPDPTCEPFEVVPCEVFVTEATFGTPSFRWEKGSNLGREIFEWWQSNAAEGRNSLIFAYSLGKAQRVLGVLEPFAERPIYCHHTVTGLTDCYRAQGVKLAPTVCLSEVAPTRKLRGELFLAPQSFLKTEQADLLGKDYRTAFASGWMAQGTRGYDHGFTMSDHADWDDLVRTVQETGARRVYVQHRGNGALVKHLKTLGLEAFPDTELKQAAPSQLSLFGGVSV
jgi:putative mRNA 3-end processing factor